LSVYYRFDFPNGTRYIIEAEPLSPEVARDVLASTTEEYTMVTPHQPVGKPAYFLAGVQASYGFIVDRLQVDPTCTRFLYAIMPLITRIAPPDDILAAADLWYATEQANLVQQTL